MRIGEIIVSSFSPEPRIARLISSFDLPKEGLQG